MFHIERVDPSAQGVQVLAPDYLSAWPVVNTVDSRVAKASEKRPARFNRLTGSRESIQALITSLTADVEIVW